ncbi:MAG: DNA recombination protein RmuC [Oligoflexia bacterium]|nr:DNA recombination protein RmuC [Oligoflexia bacterium]
MNDALIYLSLFLSIVTVSGLFLVLKSLRKKDEPNTSLILQQQMQGQMQEELRGLREEISRNLAESTKAGKEDLKNLSQQLNERMKETSTTLHSTQESVGLRLDNAAKVVGELQKKLGQMEESSKKIYDLGQGLQDLKDILKSPKLRGNMGEFFLEDLLRQILPPDHYSLQHTFRSGEKVDAIIKLGGSMVSVDSKFPLESFVRLIQISEDQGELKKKEKRAFITAIKKHADAIAKKYILPDEGTFDFALMYIPAENIYYETIIKDDLLEESGSLYSYLLNKKVIPVSPNSLYAYLQVIILGLRGMKVQEHAKQIIADLQRVEVDLTKFKTDYVVLGKHLKNASSSYDESTRKIEKFEQRFTMITEIGGQLGNTTEQKSLEN